MGFLKVIETKYSLKENIFDRTIRFFVVFIYNIRSKLHKVQFPQFVNEASFYRKLEGLQDSRSNYVVTCYFTKLKDPQHGIVRNKPNFNYIKPWYNSVNKLALNGIIVHDGLDTKFIEQYQTENIKFLRYTPGQYSIFEERWMAYFLLLKSNPEIQNAFFTDGNDVTVNYDPFKRHLTTRTLFVGRDQINRVGDSKWVIDEMNAFIEESGYKVSPSIVYQPLFNAGLVGGQRKVLISLLSKIVELTLQAQSDKHKDMSLLNIAIHEIFKPKLDLKYYQEKLTNPDDDFAYCLKGIVTGALFNSPFKLFEENSKSTFSHK